MKPVSRRRGTGRHGGARDSLSNESDCPPSHGLQRLTHGGQPRCSDACHHQVIETGNSYATQNTHIELLEPHRSAKGHDIARRYDSIQIGRAAHQLLRGAMPPSPNEVPANDAFGVEWDRVAFEHVTECRETRISVRVVGETRR